VRKIATNPAYIGWKIWGGEVVSKDVYPPLVDEATFWTVQKRFGSRDRPKQCDPLPLAGLLYCGNHNIPRKMTYTNMRLPHYSQYRCFDYDFWVYCTSITAQTLDGPISEAVISELMLSELLSERTLQKYTDEYEQAKAQAASYRREMKRLVAEVENLRGNLVIDVISADQLQWLDRQIQQRLARIKELADLESQPIRVIHSIPGQSTIEDVKAFLENLNDEWQGQPNGFKNAVLRLLLDRVTIWHNPATIRVKLVWRAGFERELLIQRPHKRKYQPWTEHELEVLKKHYGTVGQYELMEMLPDRSWPAIKHRGSRLGLSRKKTGSRRCRPYTPEEDELIRRYYADEIGRDEVLSTGRTTSGIKNRARRLGLTWQPRQATWDWLDDGYPISQKEDSTG
jgi:hypothetical protein